MDGIRTVEVLDREMGAIMARLQAKGLDQGALATIQLAALVKTLVDNGTITEHQWAEHSVNMLQEIEMQVNRAAILGRLGS